MAKFKAINTVYAGTQELFERCWWNCSWPTGPLVECCWGAQQLCVLTTAAQALLNGKSAIAHSSDLSVSVTNQKKPTELI
jgi:hypothetical protein